MASADPKPPARYLVGIDLGTTHTVVAFADLREGGRPAIRLFEIDQLVAPGEVARRAALPSLRYHPGAGELPEGDLLLPWPPAGFDEQSPPAVLGSLARELGSKVPGHLVASAKSWLSHRAVDRTAPILPWGAPEGVKRVSPVLASASYLAHVRAAWDRRHADAPLAEQEIILTVPASFDEAARALTVDAARMAGLHGLRLLEEPQAACYDWLDRHRATLHAELGGARLLLVCDVGGGTTDLTLIRIDPSEGGPGLTRVGVGDHLMLGGDNMDLALAQLAESRLPASGARLSAASLSQLTQQCRSAKERLLSSGGPAVATVTVLGTGGKLIAGSQSAEIESAEVRRLVLDGFFPMTDRDDRPRRTRGGIVEFGLPYAADPAISSHLAEFLTRHADDCRGAVNQGDGGGEKPRVPDTVLLNGGVFRSEALAARLVDLLSGWLGAPVRRLVNSEPELAVARGAVAYGIASRGFGVRIGGGSPRSYFLRLEAQADRAGRCICLLPRGAGEGTEFRLADRIFSWRVGQPVRFHLASTTADRVFQPGELVEELAQGAVQLPPMATVLEEAGTPGSPAAREVPVQLSAMLTEVGTLELNCVSAEMAERRWKLEFQLRGQDTAVVAGMLQAQRHPRAGDAAQRLRRIFGDRSRNVHPREVKTLRADLEKTLGKREEWTPSLLRDLFTPLWEGVKRRRRTIDHERLWFNWAGFCLRPGFGYPLDDWRLEELWSIYDQGVQYGKEARVWAEWWTLWRRVAGGLYEAHQVRLLDDIEGYIQPPGSTVRKRPPGPKKQGYDDMVRLAGALEHVPVERKVQLGFWLLERLRKQKESNQSWWAVGRLGARVPLHQSTHNVVPNTAVEEWLETLFKVDWKAVRAAAFAATLLARMSGDRSRDLDTELRGRVAKKLRQAKVPPSWVRMVEEVAELDQTDEQRAFGDSLPPGLRLMG